MDDDAVVGCGDLARALLEDAEAEARTGSGDAFLAGHLRHEGFACGFVGVHGSLGGRLRFLLRATDKQVDGTDQKKSEKNLFHRKLIWIYLYIIIR